MAEPIDKTYIDLRVKEILAARGMTITELAERMGKHQQYVSNIINISPATSLGSLIAIAKTLGVPFRDLFGPGEYTEPEPKAQYGETSLMTKCPHCGHPIEITIK